MGEDRPLGRTSEQVCLPMYVYCGPISILVLNLFAYNVIALPLGSSDELTDVQEQEHTGSQTKQGFWWGNPQTDAPVEPGSGLRCIRYLAFHKSQAGKVSIPTNIPTCKGSKKTRTPCVETCQSGRDTYCFNSYQDMGYGSSIWSGYSKGGGSRNYGRSEGGCMIGHECVDVKMERDVDD